MLGRAYNENENKKLSFWFKEEKDLLKYATQKHEIKKNINRIPKDPPMVIPTFVLHAIANEF